jgi:hypothetical protein
MTISNLTRSEYKPMNTYYVSKRQWGKWTVVGKHVFNKTYGYMTENPHLFVHPKAELVLTEHFKTTAWNAAWTAADVCSRGELHLMKSLEVRVRSGE